VAGRLLEIRGTDVGAGARVLEDGADIQITRHPGLRVGEQDLQRVLGLGVDMPGSHQTEQGDHAIDQDMLTHAYPLLSVRGSSWRCRKRGGLMAEHTKAAHGEARPGTPQETSGSSYLMLVCVVVYWLRP
jgi:hypothetical protein